MDAVLLAGGEGTRMRPLTYTTPKPLLPFLNQPLLARILGVLAPVAARAHVTSHVRFSAMRAWADAWNSAAGRPAVDIVEEREALGTGGALRNCLDRLGPRVLVMNADIVCDVDARALVAFHERHAARGALGTVAVTPVADPSAYGVVAMDGERIAGFVEKPPPGKAPSDLINAGLYVLEREAVESLPSGKSSLERDLFPRLAAQGALRGHRLAGFWSDVGRPASYLAAHVALLERAGQPGVVAAGARVDGAAELDRAALGRGCTVEREARIARSVLFDDVRVGRGARIADSIVGHGCRLEAGAVVEDAVLADGTTVEAGSTVKGRRVGLRPGDTYL